MVIAVVALLTGGVVFAHGLVDQSQLSGPTSSVPNVIAPTGQEFTPARPSLVGVDVGLDILIPNSETTPLPLTSGKGQLHPRF